MDQVHWQHEFNANVVELRERDHYVKLAYCLLLALACAVVKEAITDKPSVRFMIRSRTRVVRLDGTAQTVSPPGTGRGKYKSSPVPTGKILLRTCFCTGEPGWRGRLSVRRARRRRSPA